MCRLLPYTIAPNLTLVSVKRIGTATYAKAVRLDNGWVRAPATLTRTGVFAYFHPKTGKIVRELRLPEEVFHPDAVKSFDLIPLTDDHPYHLKDGRVTSKNFKSVTSGIVGNVRQNGINLDADVNVADEELGNKVLAGTHQLSNGYDCDKEAAAPGAKWNGIPYDFIQRNIRGNHVAVVKLGRAGHGVSQIHLDADDAYMNLDAEDAIEIEDITPEIASEALGPEVVKKMNKLNLDGVDYELADEVIASVTKLQSEKAALEKNVTDMETTRARLDAADKEVIKLNEELKTAVAYANDVTRIEGLVKSRVELETKVRTVVADFNCDGLSELDIKKGVVAKLDTELNLDGKSAEAVDAYFDALTKYASKRNAVTEAVGKVLESTKAVNLDSALAPSGKFIAEFNKKFVR